MFPLLQQPSIWPRDMILATLRLFISCSGVSDSQDAMTLAHVGHLQALCCCGRTPSLSPATCLPWWPGDLAQKRGCVQEPCLAATVTLRIYTEAKDIDRVSWAMESLKQAMKWDEETFGDDAS